MVSSKSIKTFFIRTFGCQMNEHDSSRMESLLEAQGLTRAESARKADLIIINSCSVRAKPEHKALSEAGRYQPARKNRGARVVLAGCVGQQGGQDLLNRTRYLDGVIGPDAVTRLPAIVRKLEQGQIPVLDVAEHTMEQPCFVSLQGTKQTGVSALVTIMKGCNNFCSYCIVPYVRGREVSRDLGDILGEVERLVASGCREVTLLGQNVNSYQDRDGTSFPRLLRELDRQGAVDRIRFTTSHPKDLSLELVQAMAELARVCEHVHLGLQSGSERVLQRMNRGHTPAVFVEKALAFRQAIPGISLTTDIIVGFPSETEEDFEQTMQVVSEVAFDQAFSFKYSPRPGTMAARQADDVPGEVKAERLNRLQALLADLESRSLQTLAGKVMPVLVEGTSLRDEKALTGRTRCNRVVNFEAPAGIAVGSTVDVEVVEVRGHTLWGRDLRFAGANLTTDR